MKYACLVKLKYFFIVLMSSLSLWSFASQAVTFNAESYDEFFDTTPGNTGGAFRNDNVDIEATTDIGGFFNVGWIEAGEWLVYHNFVVPTTGSYVIRMRVASMGGATASVDLNAGAIQLGNFVIPATNGWQNWTTVSRTVTLNAGTFNLGVFAQTNGWNFNWIEIVPAAASSSVASSKSSSSSSVASININVDRSLFIHDSTTLQAADFSFRSTLQQLVNQLNVQNPSNLTTVDQLFARMWDTQNPLPGKVAGGEKCTGILNGFAVECRPQEGSQAENPQLFVNNYLPISLVNRFDLRDTVNFNDCGEYRIIYANQAGGGRNFIIFEAEVPNPTPGVVAGCLSIAQFWQNLSAENNLNTRAASLRNFYFNGLPSSNVRPVIDIRNYANATGQIRANMFMGGSWNLKEFKVAVSAQGLSVIKPVSVKSNPVAFLFDGNSTDSRAAAFQSNFITNMGSLLLDFNSFSLTVANDAHNNGQSHASFPIDENQFFEAFTNTNTNAFQQNVSNRLNALRSPLTSTQAMNRATAMTCGGCHQPGSFGLTAPDAIGAGQRWPDTLGFTHVSEFANAGVFPISPALTDTFLPARLAGFNSFLANTRAVGAAQKPRAAAMKPAAETQSSSSSSSVPARTFNKRAG